MKPLIMLADSHTPFNGGELAFLFAPPHPTEHARATHEELSDILEEEECGECGGLFKKAMLQPVNKNLDACPDCHRDIMRDFRACDE